MTLPELQYELRNLYRVKSSLQIRDLLNNMVKKQTLRYWAGKYEIQETKIETKQKGLFS